VNHKLKDELRPVLRMNICREIGKHYAAWRFLEVMDSSSQSLNQVCITFFFVYQAGMRVISKYCEKSVA
jgi:hypothetical protein